MLTKIEIWAHIAFIASTNQWFFSTPVTAEREEEMFKFVLSFILLYIVGKRIAYLTLKVKQKELCYQTAVAYFVR